MTRKPGHRPDRESERNNFRSENKALRKQVAKLRKRVTKLSEEEPTEAEKLDTTEAAEEGQCPLCGKSSLGVYRSPISGKILIGCRSCKKYKGKSC